MRLGQTVRFLKMPYMLRESCQPNLARTIAVTPKLRYVDLPEGLFTDDPSFATLRLEVQARCLELRKMTYMRGSERSLQALATGTIWTHLEVLELVKVNIDPAVIRQALGCLGNLRALKISETAYISDLTMAWNDMLPPFPALEELILNDVPNVTIEGIKAWLMMPEAREALRVITLDKTGVDVATLHEVLGWASRLKHVSVMDSVTVPMPTAVGQQGVPPLQSASLETLHFEILAGASAPKYSGVKSSYYDYLAGSLLAGGLPNLRALYVRDPNFADLLLGLPTPVPMFAEGAVPRPSSSGSSSGFSPRAGNSGVLSPGFSPKSPTRGSLTPSGSNPAFAPSPQQFNPGHNPRFSSNNPFAPMVGLGSGSIANLPAKLEVFTKGDDEIGWSFVNIGADAAALNARHNGNSGRPLSSYGLGADVLGGSSTGWSSGAGARRSILIGGAGGAFLAVPPETTGSARGRKGAGTNGAAGAGATGEDLWPRPMSSAGETKKERLDLWR